MSEEKLDRILEDVTKVRTSVARIDERTQQHEKRMDRADRRAGILGSISGLFAGLATALFRTHS